LAPGLARGCPEKEKKPLIRERRARKRGQMKRDKKGTFHLKSGGSTHFHKKKLVEGEEGPGKEPCVKKTQGEEEPVSSKKSPKTSPSGDFKILVSVVKTHGEKKLKGRACPE